MDEQFQGGKCTGTGKVDTGMAGMIPPPSMQARSFAIEGGGAPFVVHNAIGSKHKKHSGEDPMVDLANEVLHHSGSDLRVAKSDGRLAAHRVRGRLQPLAGGFFGSEKFKSFSKNPRKPSDTITFVLVKMPCLFATMECCS